MSNPASNSMNDPANVPTHGFANGPAPAALHEAAKALRDALLAERTALDAKDAQALAGLAAEKRRRVLTLERALGPAHPSRPTPSAETVALLRECRELNARNATGVAMRLAAVRSSLVRLARLSGVDDAWGYSADGAPARPVRGRTLGRG